MLSKTGWIKQLKSLLIASAGAGLTVFAQGISGLEFGVYTPIVFAVSSVLVNVLKTYLEEK